MVLVNRLLGQYTRSFISVANYLPVTLLCILLYARGTERRKHFPFRFLLGSLSCLAILYGTAVLRTQYNTVWTRFFANFITYYTVLPLLFLCYRDSLLNILMIWCSAVATQDISSRLFTLLVYLSGHDCQVSISLFHDYFTNVDWLIMYLLEAFFCILLYLVFHQRNCSDPDPRTFRLTVILSIFFTLWMIVIHSISRQYMGQSPVLYSLILVSLTTFSITVLILHNGILTAVRYRQDIATMEKLQSEERKLYDSIKENINIVNMRCHDLKHQLEALSFKLTEKELSQLKEAIKLYDNTIKTGSEALDVVIYEKQLIFQKEGIRFTVMADGSILQFMRTTHIYSLFSNALSNALEAVRKLPSPDKRIIDLTVCQVNQQVEISVMNYFTGELPANGKRTTKNDPAQHGFGLRSMSYIVESYGGTLDVSENGTVFEVVCRIPIPKS